MKQYRTIEIVSLFGGLIALTDEQAAHRQHHLEPVKKQEGVYTITGEVQFKVGEKIGLEDPDKATLAKLVDLDPDPELKQKKGPGRPKKNDK